MVKAKVIVGGLLRNHLIDLLNFSFCMQMQGGGFLSG